MEPLKDFMVMFATLIKVSNQIAQIFVTQLKTFDIQVANWLGKE